MGKNQDPVSGINIPDPQHRTLHRPRSVEVGRGHQVDNSAPVCGGGDGVLRVVRVALSLPPHYIQVKSRGGPLLMV
jgi:hypothetical protein